jgi:hypothetical protein
MNNSSITRHHLIRYIRNGFDLFNRINRISFLVVRNETNKIRLIAYFYEYLKF